MAPALSRARSQKGPGCDFSWRRATLGVSAYYAQLSEKLSILRVPHSNILAIKQHVPQRSSAALWRRRWPYFRPRTPTAPPRGLNSSTKKGAHLPLQASRGTCGSVFTCLTGDPRSMRKRVPLCIASQGAHFQSELLRAAQQAAEAAMGPRRRTPEGQRPVTTYIGAVTGCVHDPRPFIPVLAARYTLSAG